eukprot:PhF_6_TR38928/c0_g1_i2/m.58239/K06886/glbN; hemoglobin
MTSAIDDPDPKWASAAKFFGDLGPTHYEKMGGEQGVHRVAKAFYQRVFRDPVLQMLFLIPDHAHAEHLFMFLAYFCEIDEKYMVERGGFFTSHEAHQRVKDFPQRLQGPKGAGCPGRAFTHTQKNAWKGHFMWACETVGNLRGGLLKDMSDWVDRMMFLYGPFDNDREE